MAHMHDARRRRQSIRLKGYDYSQAGAYFVTIVTQSRLCVFGEVLGEQMRLNEAGAMARQTWEALPRRFPGIGIDAFMVMPNHIHGIVIINQLDADDLPVGVPLVGTPKATHTPNLPDYHARASTRVAPTNTSDIANDSPVGVPLVGTPKATHTPNLPDCRARATTRVAPTNTSDIAHDLPVGVPLVGTPNATHTSVDAPRTTLGDVVGAYKSLTTVEYTRGVKTLNWPPFERRMWQRNYHEHIVRDDESLNLIRQYILDNPSQWALDRENPAALNTQVAPP